MFIQKNIDSCFNDVYSKNYIDSCFNNVYIKKLYRFKF